MTILYWLFNNSNFFISSYQFVYFFQAFEYLFCTFFFSHNLPKRKYTWLWMILSSILLLAWSYLIGFLRSLNEDSSTLRILYILSYYIFTFLIISFVYKEKSWTNILLTWITALCVRELIDVSQTLISLALNLDTQLGVMPVTENHYLNCFIYDAIHLVLLFIYYFIFFKHIHTIEDRAISIKIIVISLLMLLALVVIKTFIVFNSTTDKALYSCCELLIGLLTLLLLVVRTDILKESSYKLDQKVMNQVLASNQSQYETLKTNINIINMKSHDMKHQLEKYQDKLTEEEVKNISKAIEVYDKNINTGNSVLDTVLYSESLICEKKNIRFTYLCDGKNLDRFSTSQIYYLLSNILDNAIEASEEVDEDSRVISFNIKEKNNQIVIDSCNYYKGDRNVDNGVILSTTKKDDKHHGFGMKSIKMIVEENKGTISVSTKDNMFFLVVNLPIPEKEILSR